MIPSVDVCRSTQGCRRPFARLSRPSPVMVSCRSIRASQCSSMTPDHSVELSRLHEFSSSANFDPPVSTRRDHDLRPDSLSDYQRAPEAIAHDDRGGTRCLILENPEVCRERSRSHPACGLILPCPDIQPWFPHGLAWVP